MHDPGHHWVTIAQFAAIYRRTRSWAHKLCESGAIYDFGFSVYRAAGGNGAWWIRVPNKLLAESPLASGIDS